MKINNNRKYHKLEKSHLYQRQTTHKQKHDISFSLLKEAITLKKRTTEREKHKINICIREKRRTPPHAPRVIMQRYQDKQDNNNKPILREDSVTTSLSDTADPLSLHFYIKIFLERFLRVSESFSKTSSVHHLPTLPYRPKTLKVTTSTTVARSRLSLHFKTYLLPKS